MKEWITNVITRELKALRREIETYPSEADLWEIPAGISNRDAEFASRDVPRTELLREIDNAIAAVQTGMGEISEADLAKPYPEKVGGVSESTGAFLAHFATHLAYHLGQVDYHRRIMTGEGKTVKAMALTELGGKPA